MERYTLDLNEEELVNFFEKYNIQELETFKVIFAYVYDYDITNEKRIVNELYYTKLLEGFDEYCVPVKAFNSHPSDLIKKNKSLTDKEIEFLYNLADDALSCLESINHYDIEEIKTEIDKIVESAYKEKEARQQMKGKSIKLNLKTKKEA